MSRAVWKTNLLMKVFKTRQEKSSSHASRVTLRYTSKLLIPHVCMYCYIYISVPINRGITTSYFFLTDIYIYIVNRERCLLTITSYVIQN